MTLVVVKKLELGKTEEAKAMEKEYNVFHDKAAQSIKTELDLTHLGIKSMSSSPAKTHQGNQLLTKISLKWQNMLNVTKNEDICSQRIIYIQSLYQKYFLAKYVYINIDDKSLESDPEFIDIFNYALLNYTKLDLFNDFQHIKDKCLKNSQDWKKFRHCLNDGFGVNICCDALFSKFREQRHSRLEKDTKHKYLGSLDKKQIHVLEIVSRIHIALNHEDHEIENDQEESEAMERRIIQRRKERVNENAVDSDKLSKFINEIESKDREKNKNGTRGSIDDLYGILISHGMSDTDATSFMEELLANAYDTDAAIDDIAEDEDICNVYDQSNLYPLLGSDKFIAKQIKKHFMLKQNDDDEIPLFKFGDENFMHWSSFKWNKRYIKTPKYKSLKEETLKNKIHCIDIELWQEMVESAYLFSQTNRAKELKADEIGNENANYEMPAGFPLSASQHFHSLQILSF